MTDRFVLLAAGMMFALSSVCADDRANRIDEIAGWLPVEPGVTADPIGVRTHWDVHARSDFGRKTLAKAETVLTQQVPSFTDDDYLEYSRTGKRYRTEKNYFARIENLTTLMMAECLQNQGRFLAKIDDYLNTIAGMKAWTMPAHDAKLDVFNGRKFNIDLGAAHYAWTVSSVLAVLRGRLNPETVARSKGELQRRVFDIYIIQMRHPEQKRLSWYYDRANWNAVCNGNTILSALAVIDDRRLRAEFVESGERTVPKYLAGFTSDGYCSEGVGYWDYGFSNHLRFALAIRQLTGGRVDFFQDPKWRAVVEYGYGIQLQPGRAPQFADGEGQPSIENMALGRLAYPDLVPPKRSRASLAVGGWATFAVRGFGQETPIDRPSPFEDLPLRTWFGEAQVLLARSAPGDRAFGGAIKGGDNGEMHNHNDVGSWQVMLEGLVMAGDPEAEVYTSRTFSKDRYVAKVLSSYGHPVPVVDRKLQSPGVAFAAKVVHTDFSDAVDRIELDLASAYEVPKLTSLRRTFEYDRTKGTVAIRDRATFSEPGMFEVPVVTYMDVVADYERGGYAFQSADRSKAVRVTATASGGAWRIVTELMENPTRRSPKRLAVRFDAPVTEAEVAWTFSASTKK